MFGVDTSELLVVAVVALLFIGPKELPRVMMMVGRWVGKIRGYARHFTSGIENVIREAELAPTAALRSTVTLAAPAPGRPPLDM